MGKFICIDGRYEKESEFKFSRGNRAFRYGDGFFETMHYAYGSVQLFEKHHRRLLKAMQLLKMQSSSLENPKIIHKEIVHLINANHQFKGARIRLTIFRSGGGLYKPETQQASYLIESDTLESDTYPLNTKGISINYYDVLAKPINSFQFYKSLNTTVSILASIHAEESKVDDCLLMNTDGYLIESTSSNVFFIQNKVIYTPDLDSGCIEGIMRDKVIEKALQLRFSVIEGAQIRPEHLTKFDEIFLTNAIQGIQWVSAYKNKRYFNKQTQIIHRALIADLLPTRS